VQKTSPEQSIEIILKNKPSGRVSKYGVSQACTTQIARKAKLININLPRTKSLLHFVVVGKKFWNDDYISFATILANEKSSRGSHVVQAYGVKKTDAWKVPVIVVTRKHLRIVAARKILRSDQIFSNSQLKWQQTEMLGGALCWQSSKQWLQILHLFSWKADFSSPAQTEVVNYFLTRK